MWQVFIGPGFPRMANDGRGGALSFVLVFCGNSTSRPLGIASRPLREKSEAASKKALQSLSFKQAAHALSPCDDVASVTRLVFAMWR